LDKKPGEAGSQAQVLRIGIFGGSFDPPHNGHVNLLTTATQKIKTDKVLIIPTGTPPHKEISATPFAERFKMAQLAFPNYEVSDMEGRSQKVSYTIDTLSELHKKYPGARFWLFIGSDMKNSFKSWKNYAKILELCEIYTVNRDIIQISSTNIRNNLIEYKHMIPAAVYDYIIQKGLYK